MEIVHTALWTRDLTESLRFYVDGLGLEQTWRFVYEGVDNCYIGGENGLEIQLKHDPTGLPDEDLALSQYNPEQYHVALSIESVIDTLEMVSDVSSCRVLACPETVGLHTEGNLGQSAIVEGPEGFPIQLLEHDTTSESNLGSSHPCVDHLSVWVDDLAPIEQFYTHTIALEGTSSATKSRYPVYVVKDGLNNTIQFVEAPSSISPSQQFDHFALTVEDVDEWTDHLASIPNCAVLQKPFTMPADGGTYRLAFIRDPVGNVLELLQEH